MEIKGVKMKHNRSIWLLVFILILLIADFIYNSFMLIDYERRKDSGNDRWKQVEERILRIENKVLELEENLGGTEDGTNG